MSVWVALMHQTHRRKLKHLRDVLSMLSSTAAEEEEPQTAPLQTECDGNTDESDMMS